MSVVAAQRLEVTAAAPARRRWGPHHPPRPRPTSWPSTELRREDVIVYLTAAFATGKHPVQARRSASLGLFFEWLEERPGRSWQERWGSIESDLHGQCFRRHVIAWLTGCGRPERYQQDFFAVAARLAICGDVVRPSLGWLLSGSMGQGALTRILAVCRDPEGFTRLLAHCDSDRDITPGAASRTRYRAALIMAAKGGGLSDITIGDVVELFDAEADTHGSVGVGSTLFYRVLRETGILGDQAPPRLRHLRTGGKRTPEQMIDRYNLACRPVRDLLVDYLKERQPALDYASLETLANLLGNRFWADLEAHNPGIDSLHLRVEVAAAWKERLRTLTKKVHGPNGETTHTVVSRLSYRECLTPVRAFYLDLAHWAIEDPGRWAAWVAPCPIGADEGAVRKATRQRKARIDARTRQQLPVLPSLVRAIEQQLKNVQELLDTAGQVTPGETFTHAATTYLRRARTDGIWVVDPTTGKATNLSIEEDHAFWAWATIDVLRHTGIRVEELLELSHHSLVQYRLPSTGELIPLLQIAPSKTDTERLLVVSPALAEVLSTIITRNRGTGGALPLVSAYDDYERVWKTPTPLLFQRRINTESRAFAHSTILKILTAAVARTGLVDQINGRPLHYSPHDFRRMFITDAILNGLPPHIAQIIAGHQDINVTLGYKAVYPQEAIQAHLAFLARRRSLRPSDEYRTPTETEWEEFLGHFERRKVSIGTCARAFATPCIHEHACVRCPMLWPDPGQRPRLAEIRDNPIARIAEAEQEGWLGDVEGLQVSLAGAEHKLAQLDRKSRRLANKQPHTPQPRTATPDRPSTT